MPSLRNIGWPYDEDISFPVYGIFDSIMVTNFGVVPLLRKLTNVTKIDLSGNKSITDNFPVYGMFDSICVTDSGVVPLSRKLTNLTRIDLLGNKSITDKNCVLLRDVSILDYPLITQKTIGDALRGLPNLVTVGLGGIRIASIDSFFQRSFVCVKGLCVIKFSKSPISDELLHWLANLCLPLKKVLFSECYNFSFVGLCFLLSKNCFPEYLNLEGANFLSDGSMIELSQYLSRLMSINVKYLVLSILTFRHINKTRMESTNLGVEESTTELVIDPRNKSLHLAWNGNLGDELMKKVAFICPNLQLLDVSDYRIITKEGIGEIFKSCGEIQCLRIESCRHINSLGIKHFDVKKLEVLQVGASRINGDTLITIANTCPRLLYLNLSCCIYVTTRGVKEMVEKCRALREILLALREILLYFCRNVDANILPGIVFLRQSLGNIGWLSDEDATENQRNLLLSHGCGISCYLDCLKV
ncbi:hypothetical protein ACOSP7_009779 [Xanthoceras sorbifolium]